MHAELRAIREERDMLRCELVDSRAEVADYRELQTQLTRARALVAHLDREMARLSAELDRVITTGVTPIPNSSASQDGGRRSPRCFRRSQPFGPDSLSAIGNTRFATPHSCRRTPDVFRCPSNIAPAPNVFRGASAAGLINFRRYGRSSPHYGARGHSQPDGHQHGRTARPTQRAEPCLFKLHASTGARSDSRPSTWDSTGPSPGKYGCVCPANAAYVRGSTSHQPISTTAGPHGCPSSTGGIPHFRSGPIRATTCFHASPGCSLYSPSANGLPDLRQYEPCKQMMLDPMRAMVTAIYSRACAYPRSSKSRSSRPMGARRIPAIISAITGGRCYSTGSTRSSSSIPSKTDYRDPLSIGTCH
ncbi:hypothetical protein CRG98_030060 [Punica granatum]|uniref:Uncharacterized protein n=1 Tax=Punica granatum TaxID=22663 RepID=A0A2I0J1F7_PUNGR|nr:hypothetical protein CRG98_030060 [Punica granatum]